MSPAVRPAYNRTGLLKFKYLPEASNRNQMILKEMFTVEQKYAQNWKLQAHAPWFNRPQNTANFGSPQQHVGSSGLSLTTPSPSGLPRLVHDVQQNLSLIESGRRQQFRPERTFEASPQQVPRHSPNPFGRVNFFSSRNSFYY